MSAPNGKFTCFIVELVVPCGPTAETPMIGDSFHFPSLLIECPRHNVTTCNLPTKTYRAEIALRLWGRQAERLLQPAGQGRLSNLQSANYTGLVSRQAALLVVTSQLPGHRLHPQVEGIRSSYRFCWKTQQVKLSAAGVTLLP